MKSVLLNSIAGSSTGTPLLGDLLKVEKRKLDYVANRSAPTLDDIFARVKAKKLLGSENVKTLFDKVLTPKSNLTSHIEQFNFGVLRTKDIIDAEREGHEFIREGLFQLPYPVCLYRCQVHYEEGPPVGMALLLVDTYNPSSPVHVGDGNDREGYACVAFTMSDTHMTAMHTINTLGWKEEPTGTAVQFEIPKDEATFWELTAYTGSDGKKMALQDMCEGCQLSIGLTMILNTKNIHKERVAPPTKPNKARERAGKPLLPWVTRVYTGVYNQATEPGEGTHASPRPHRRRAHVRHYPATPYREAYKKPIAAMLVNWDGKPLERGQYEVHGE